jgi:hypothetical protein
LFGISSYSIVIIMDCGYPRTEERIAALGLDIGSRNGLTGGRTRIREYILQRLKGIGAWTD